MWPLKVLEQELAARKDLTSNSAVDEDGPNEFKS